MARRRNRRNKHKMIRFIRSFLITFVVAALLGTIVLLVLKTANPSDAGAQKTQDTAEAVAADAQPVRVDGMNTAKFSKDELKEALMEKHPWNLTVTGDDGTITLENEYEKRLDSVLSQAYASLGGEQLSTDFDEESAEQYARELVNSLGVDMNTAVSQNSAMVYNPETDSFDFFDAPVARIPDLDTLESDIKNALLSGDFDKQLVLETSAGDQAYKAEDFKVIGSYTTNTTNNADRNTNVRLSCEAVNGTVLQPGQRFSYNETLGKRTAEKGYKEAGAYANGEHVTELGGGVCQLSSTLYNATIAANLQVDERTGHTYEPTYVTPGEDATVSYSKPDYSFTNSSGGPVGISAHYADRVVTVKIYGLPQLDEGITRHLRSEKIEDIDPPLPNYIEDPTVVPGYEDVVKKGKSGSKWKTYIVLEKDGEVVSEEYLHTTTYKGEPATIRRNLNGLAALGFTLDANGNLVPAIPVAPQQETAPEAGD